MNFDGCFVTNNRKVISKKIINIYFIYAKKKLHYEMVLFQKTWNTHLL